LCFFFFSKTHNSTSYYLIGNCSSSSTPVMRSEKNKNAFQLKADQPKSRYRHTLLCFCDLHFDLMTLIHEFDLSILKTYMRTKNELSRSRLSKVRASQTHTHTPIDASKNTTTQHLRVE